MMDRFALTFVAEEFTRDVEFFAPNNNHLLAAQGLLGDDRGKTTKKMTLAVNDNHLFFSF